MIKVLLADDHQIVTDGLRSFLAKEPGIEVVGVAQNGKEVIDLLGKLEKVDVAVLDIEMPEMDGIEATRKIRKEFPETEVLILSMYKKREFIIRLFENGMSGYVLKNKSAEELVTAIRTVATGNTYIGLEISNELKDVRRWAIEEEAPQLTKKEREILSKIKSSPGDTYEDLAEQMKIKLYTVHTHIRNIKGKLDLNTKAELLEYAIKKGIGE
jgi:DNA-binding NarL/FixJ family response regulator